MFERTAMLLGLSKSLGHTLSDAIQMSDGALSEAVPVIARWQLLVTGSSILVT